MTKSTHRVEVVPVRLEPHPNADSLSVVRVYGYSCCVRTEDWVDGELGAYVVPDSVVPTTRPEFTFLAREGKATYRIRVVRLRGVLSMGLLVKAPPGAKEGDDVAAQFGVERYEPPLPMSTGGEDERAPFLYAPTYDVEPMLRYTGVFERHEPVWVSEKLHGANARYVFEDGRMHAGSRTRWKREDSKSIWWRALRRHPEIEAFCRAHEGAVLYGEVYGMQDLKYGVPKGEVRFAAFDLLVNGEWSPPERAWNRAIVFGVPWVPLLRHYTRFDLEEILALADGKSWVPGADNMREGIVVRPTQERTDPEVGRVQLKLVSNNYLERGK